MKKFFVHVIAGVIPFKKLRRKVRSSLLNGDQCPPCNKHGSHVIANVSPNLSPSGVNGGSAKERLKYYSCGQIENLALIFNGTVDKSGKYLTFCCEPIGNIPGATLGRTAEESINRLVRERAALIEESKRLSLAGGGTVSDEERKYTAGCAKCVYFQLKDWKGQDKGPEQIIFSYVNLSMYPSPCQCKCIYCAMHGTEKIELNQLQTENYKKVFDLIEWVDKKGMVAANATWQISSGEITIHPYKERILNLMKGKKAVFFSNCFIFDEKIAANLAENPDSQIELSIDCGTPETWHKVKGADNFGIVMDNLSKYHANTTKSGQIRFKYIVLPGINVSDADYKSVVEIMKRLDVGQLCISRNTRLMYARKEHDALIEAAGHLVAMLRSSKMEATFCNFSSVEQERILALANKN